MNWSQVVSRRASMFAAALLIAGCAAMGGGDAVQVALSGAEEVPPVKTAATGAATLNVAADKTVTAKITTKGVAGTAAHIHEGAAGANGPVAIGLEKTGENEWSTKPGTKMTDAQYEAYKAGRLYFNVHSAQNKGGEIRGQIRPAGGGARSGY